MRKLIAPLGLPFLCAAMVLTGCGTSSDDRFDSGNGYGRAADFELPELKGGTFRLSDHNGSVILLNFWATWCPPCRAEIPDFVELQEQMGSEGLLVVGVSLDQEGFEVVEPFAQEFGINYPMVVDDGTVTRSYGDVSVVPTTYIIDREGVIQNRIRGIVSKKVLEPVLTRLLNEGGETVAATP